MQKYDWIGWFSSLIIILAIGKQIYKQWRTGSVKDVSRYLFWGQVTAEAGFVTYSYLLRNWVFFAVNVALFIENIIGAALTMSLRHKQKP